MTGPFQLSPLPWNENALEPAISARTIEFHYHKHHQTYVDTLNKLVKSTPYAEMRLEEVVRRTKNAEGEECAVFHNAAQVWNHDFYWRSLSPKKVAPHGNLHTVIERDFGSIAALTAKLLEAGQSQFGSGWAWLVSRHGQLSVEVTENAMNPMAKGVNALLTVDVWEHAYYLDYQNARPKYLEAVLGNHINWDFAADNLAREDHVVRAAAE